jgi:hypothetical protein
LLACICGDGSALPPGLLFPAANKAIYSSWVEDIEVQKHEIFIGSSPTGWSNNNIGLAWLEQVFDRYTKPQAGRSWRLLILDGHGSHVTMDFITYCGQNQILLMGKKHSEGPQGRLQSKFGKVGTVRLSKVSMHSARSIPERVL